MLMRRWCYVVVACSRRRRQKRSERICRLRGNSGLLGGSEWRDRVNILPHSFLGAAITIRVLAAMIQSIGRVAIQFRTTHPETFGGPDHPRSAFT